MAVRFTWFICALMVVTELAVLRYESETREMVRSLSAATFRLLHDEGK